MKAVLITLAAIIGIGLVGVCMVMSSKNGAISLEENVNAAKSGIDVQLSNRFNKLHELASVVKNYNEHEYNTLVKVIEARGKNMSSKEVKECTDQCMAKINVLAVSEGYPDLKAQKNCQHLLNDISITENTLAQHKKAYNEFVRDYRYYCRKFPTSFFLSFTGSEVKKYDMYEAEPEQRDTKPLEQF